MLHHNMRTIVQVSELYRMVLNMDFPVMILLSAFILILMSHRNDAITNKESVCKYKFWHREISCEEDQKIFITHHYFGYNSCQQQDNPECFLDFKEQPIKNCNEKSNCIVVPENGSYALYHNTQCRETQKPWSWEHVFNMVIYQCLPGSLDQNLFDMCGYVNVSRPMYATLQAIGIDDLCRCRVQGNTFNIRMLDLNTRQIGDVRIKSRQRQICSEEMQSKTAYNEEYECLQNQADIEVEFSHKRGNKLWLEIQGDIQTLRCGSAFQEYIPIPTKVGSENKIGSSPTSETSKDNSSVVIVAGCGAGVVVIAVVSVSILCVKRRRSRTRSQEAKNKPDINRPRGDNSVQNNPVTRVINPGTYMNVENAGGDTSMRKTIQNTPQKQHIEENGIYSMPTEEQNDDGTFNTASYWKRHKSNEAEGLYDTCNTGVPGEIMTGGNQTIPTGGDQDILNYVGPQGDIYASVSQRGDVTIRSDVMPTDDEGHRRYEGPKGDVYTMVSLNRNDE